jgi:hypothetical protein
MEKKEYLIEIMYHESGNKEVERITTDDLAWSMNQYQRNRLPLTWEIVDEKDCCGDGCCDERPEVDHATLDDLDMIHQGIVNNEYDNS